MQLNNCILFYVDKDHITFCQITAEAVDIFAEPRHFLRITGYYFVDKYIYIFRSVCTLLEVDCPVLS